MFTYLMLGNRWHGTVSVAYRLVTRSPSSFSHTNFVQPQSKRCCAPSRRLPGSAATANRPNRIRWGVLYLYVIVMVGHGFANAYLNRHSTSQWRDSIHVLSLSEFSNLTSLSPPTLYIFFKYDLKLRLFSR